MQNHSKGLCQWPHERCYQIRPETTRDGVVCLYCLDHYIELAEMHSLLRPAESIHPKEKAK